ncbi:MAG: type I glutamate--ammonia ligase [Planctomycetota bacterium]
MTPKEVMKRIKDEDILFVDVRFQDTPGLMQHLTIPASRLSDDIFENGLGFDGSSIRGWKTINESDMLVLPDPTTAFLDPFMEHKTLVMYSTIQDPITRADYGKDPRGIAKRCEAYIASTGVADTTYIGPEAEFFIFDDVKIKSSVNESRIFIDSIDGHWNMDRDEAPNQGYKIRPKEGYFPVPPSDKHQDIRSEMARILMEMGIEVETHHHEVATGGQAELDIRFNSLTKVADQFNILKYVVKNVCYQSGMVATFMPKPLYGDNGSGLHSHLSFWKNGKPLFAGDKYAGVSQECLYAIGGVMKHAGAIIAFSNPTTNSYKRLVPGFEAPVNIAYSSRNRSAAIRLPMISSSPKAKRFEFRCPDASCNPYIAFSALAMAALDGIQNKMDPGEPMDKNIYDLPPEELKTIIKAPKSLEAALDALEADHEFLMKGDVFHKDFIEDYLDYKRTVEVDQMRMRPHPHEFYMYFDI